MGSSNVWKYWCFRSASVALALLTWTAAAQARPKTDVVFLKNGDRLTGEIRALQRSKLELVTDPLGTVQIEWTEVDRVTSHFLFEVEDERGRRYFGSIRPTPEAGKIEVYGIVTTTTLDNRDVIEISQLEQDFWKALEGSLDLGFDFTQANTAVTWTMNADTKYRSENYQVKLDYSSRFQEQERVSATNRNVVNLGVEWFLGDRWLASALSQLSQSEEQSVDFRAVLGGGLGRYLIQDNRTLFSLGGGLVVNQEKFSGNEEFDTDVEALIVLSLDKFLFRSPELDFDTTFAVYPSLTTPGRVRLDLRSKVRIEIIKDLYWSASLFETFDSDPPAENVRRNDFGVTTSVGWSF